MPKGAEKVPDTFFPDFSPYMRSLATCLLSTLILGACAQSVDAGTSRKPPPGLGWDLTYKALLKDNAVHQGAWLAGWVSEHQRPPINEVLSHWDRGQIVSSVLIDHPALHAGERIGFWLVRTERDAFVLLFTDGKLEDQTELAQVDVSLYDSLMAEVQRWEQRPPLREGDAPPGAPGGYFAFLNTYDGSASRQMLLTFRDFFEPQGNGWDNPSNGRVLELLAPILNGLR